MPFDDDYASRSYDNGEREQLKKMLNPNGPLGQALNITPEELAADKAAAEKAAAKKAAADEAADEKAAGKAAGKAARKDDFGWKVDFSKC